MSKEKWGFAVVMKSVTEYIEVSLHESHSEASHDADVVCKTLEKVGRTDIQVLVLETIIEHEKEKQMNFSKLMDALRNDGWRIHALSIMGTDLIEYYSIKDEHMSVNIMLLKDGRVGLETNYMSIFDDASKIYDILNFTWHVVTGE